VFWHLESYQGCMHDFTSAVQIGLMANALGLPPIKIVEPAQQPGSSATVLVLYGSTASTEECGNLPYASLTKHMRVLDAAAIS